MGAIRRVSFFISRKRMFLTGTSRAHLECGGLAAAFELHEATPDETAPLRRDASSA
jgi:hypothetical protein